MTARIAPSAEVDKSATIGEGAAIWHLAQIRENASIGRNSILSRGVYVGPGVTVGDNCKIQNYALIYEPAKLANGVFIGPAVVLTNDEFPRAINPDKTLKSGADWKAVGVEIGEGASIGARAVCIAPVKVGAWSLVAAGAVVTKDVPEFALVAGVPAKRISWVGKAGKPLEKIGENQYRCPVTQTTYLQNGETLIEETK